MYNLVAKQQMVKEIDYCYLQIYRKTYLKYQSTESADGGGCLKVYKLLKLIGICAEIKICLVPDIPFSVEKVSFRCLVGSQLRLHFLPNALDWSIHSSDDIVLGTQAWCPAGIAKNAKTVNR